MPSLFLFTLFQRVILSPAMEIDIQFMQEALGEARAAAAGGEVPIGAVLVHDGKILARSGNRTIRDNAPTAHAGMVVLREAGRLLGTNRGLDCRKTQRSATIESTTTAERWLSG